MSEPTAPWALTGNAADREQVEKAEKKEKRRDIREAGDLSALLEMATFQRWAWRLLEKASVNSSVISHSPEMTYYNAGKQDFGHWLMDEFEKARPGSYLEIIKAHAQEKG
jgi:hypothetical protein